MFYANYAYLSIRYRKLQRRYLALAHRVSGVEMGAYIRASADFSMMETAARCRLTHTELYL